MTSFSSSRCLQYASRSISLPSRLHSKAITIETELNKLKGWEISAFSTANTPSSGEAIIQTGVVGLAELYNCVQELVQSSTTQQALLQHQQGMVIVEEALEESVELLESCSYIRDLLLTIKEHVQKLQSALRRKRGDSRTENDIKSFISFRKRSKKDVLKSLRKLKHMESRHGNSSPVILDMDHHSSIVIRVLREVTAVTILVLRGLLFFVSWPASKATKPGGWSLISKLMLTKSASASKSEAAERSSGHVVSEMGSVDIALSAILHAHLHNSDAKVSVQRAQKRLEVLDCSIASLDDGVECLFRKLVQNRVCLLNILTN